MSNEILCYILQFQSHSLILRQLIQAESGLKEYKADWLTNAKVVTRDATGRFASKGLSIKQSVQDTTAILKQGFDLTTDTIQSLLKDPEFRKRAGLAAGLPMAKLISNLITQARLNPKLTEKLDEWIANATKEFADQYGDDKSPMAQAIRNSKLTQPPKDASFNEKMEFRVAQFAAYKEALESPEDYSKRDELIGKAATAAIPIGVSLAIALGFEVAIPLFLAQGVNWATVLSSVAIGEAADFAVQKGMDKLEINNPALRIGASMVAGILAGGLVTGVNNKIKNTQRLAKEEAERLAKEKAEQVAKKETERLAKEKAERLAKEEAEQTAKEETERLAKEKAERLAKEEAEQLAKEKAEQNAKEVIINQARNRAKQLAKEKAERKAREESEQLAKEEAERLAKEKAERLAKEEVEHSKAKEEADLIAKWKNPNTPLQELVEDYKKRISVNSQSPFGLLKIKPSIPDYPRYISPERDIDYNYRSWTGSVYRDETIKIALKEIQAIEGYTGSDISKIANSYLRGILKKENIKMIDDPIFNGTDIDEIIKLLISGLNKIPRFSPKQPIVRYETHGNNIVAVREFTKDLEPGVIFRSKSFFSTTPYPSGTANGFSDGNTNLKYIIYPHKESLARDITMFNTQGESECLYQPGTNFKVIKKYDYHVSSYDDDKTMIIELEEYSAI